ncbi:MAG: hypothetical protein KBA66_18695 [Leptospiraceae bacterium]|nr:hypothetical protein [Leptospiraceae bacterium]
MIDSLRIKIQNLLKNFLERLYIYRIRFVESKWSVTFLILFIIFCFSLFIGNNIYEYYAKKKYVNIFQEKSSIVSFIRKNFSKAVEIGIVDFSSLNGIIFEDIKISQEEDFSSNKLLFTSKRIDVRLTSIFSQAVVPKKIVIYGAKLVIDIDDPSTSNLLKYIHELNLPDIYFDKLDIIVRANNQDLLQSDKPLQLSIERKNEFLVISLNDNRFLGILAGKIKGDGKVNLETKEGFLRVDFSNHDLENMPGISRMLLNLSPESGIADGFIAIDKTKEDFKVDGNLNFRKFSGDFYPISNIKANDLTINAKFSYLKEYIDAKNSESYFKRKISSPEFFYDEQIFTPNNNLKKTTISIQVDNFHKLFEGLILEDEFSIQGNMKLNMRIEETGNISDWIWIDGNGSLNNFEFRSMSPDIRLLDTNLHFIWSQNELQTGLRGKLFDKELITDMSGIISFNKAANKNLPNPLASNLKLNVTMDSLILKNFQSIYEFFTKTVSEDIKERQEKMLPESFFIQSPLYKVFLEKAKLKANLKLDDVKYRSSSHSLGKYNLDLKIESGLGNLNLSGGANNKTDTDLNLNIYFDRKMPTFEFRTKVSSLFWFDEIMDICDSSIYSDIIDFNMTFISSGNNFSDLLVNRSIAGELALRRNSFLRTNPGDNINLFELFSEENISDISLGFNAYSQDGFVRNIEVKGGTGVLRGNAAFTRSGINFGMFGQLKNKPINLSFIKTGNSCQTIKK